MNYDDLTREELLSRCWKQHRAFQRIKTLAEQTHFKGAKRWQLANRFYRIVLQVWGVQIERGDNDFNP